MTDRQIRGLIGLAAMAFVLAIVIYLITGRGHSFALSTVSVGIAGWLGGRKIGLLAATFVAGVAATIMIFQGLDGILIARDNLTFWMMCAVVGGGIGHLASINMELRAAYDEIRVLRGFLPICAGCKSIRDDEGFWRQVEDYLSEHSEVRFSHGMCPDCRAEFLAEEIPEMPLIPDESNGYPQLPLH